MLQVCGVEPESIVDGPGFRYAIFAQGCPHHCPGCHNPQTHPFEGGRPLSIEEVLEAFKENPLLSGATFSGGEPFCQAKDYAELGKAIHSIGKNVVTFTGYVYEDLLNMKDPSITELLEQTDILIDGPFVESLRDISLQFRGSSNQRVLDLKKMRKGEGK